jgi:hypothetical protein
MPENTSSADVARKFESARAGWLLLWMLLSACLLIFNLAIWGLVARHSFAAVAISDPKDGDSVEQNIVVSGPLPRQFLMPGTYLYILVRPLRYNLYYSQKEEPEWSLSGGWTAKVGIGTEPDSGAPFLICAVLTGQVLPEDWNGEVPPAGFSHCVEVKRK